MSASLQWIKPRSSGISPGTFLSHSSMSYGPWNDHAPGKRSNQMQQGEELLAQSKAHCQMWAGFLSPSCSHFIFSFSDFLVL